LKLHRFRVLGFSDSSAHMQIYVLDRADAP
jgi:hypothetical protein